jgi:hypothetical protein
MDRLLASGSTGPDVASVQQQLNASPPTRFPPLAVDGIFGPLTLARVREFQQNNGLKVDGIVGPLTRAALQRRRGSDIPARTGVNCGNSVVGNSPRVTQQRESFRTQFAQVGATSAAGLPGAPVFAALPSLPTLRRLTSAQEATARSVFGASLDLTNVFISDKTGAGNLPFTVAIPGFFFTPTKQIMNLGTFSPSRDLLIHELTHVWQSQHHPDPTAFMSNSVAGQAMAVAANELAAQTDATVRVNSDFPVHFPFSTYAYVPGNPFGTYGAEQIANSVEHGETPIVSHVSSVPAGAVDGDNKTSLFTTRIGDRRASGIVF